MIDVSYAQQLFQSLLQNTEPSPALDKFFPWVPLNDYGMPLPGPNFTATAVRAGDPAPTIEGTGAKKHCLAFGPRLHYLYRRALYDSNSVLTVDVKGVPKPTSMVPGHLLGGNAYACNGGPRPAKVMLIGKHPGIEELAQSSNLVGPSSEELWKAMEAIGLSPADYNDWYATNLVKWPNLDPHSDGLPKAWINDCRPLLEMEIRICQPDYILCLGSDSSKALLGTSCGVEAMNGRVMHYSYPSELTEDGWTIKTAKVMTSVHPAYVSRRPELFDSFKDQLALFVRLAGGGDVGGEEKDVVRHYVYSERRLAALVDAALADPEQQFMAFDGEWHGQHPQDENAYLRTIQFSTQHKQAVTVVLRHQGGAPAFIPNIAAAIRQLKRLTTPVPGKWEPRVGGHFFRADLPWLLHEGLDLRDQYAPHPDPAVRDSGGWDTSLLYHAVNETASFKLEDIGMRLTSMPRYDVQLQRWKKIACKILDEEEKTLEGYGMAPDEILHPYACLRGDSLVQLGDGSWEKISRLVKTRYSGTVKAFYDGKTVNAAVVNWHRAAVNQKEWYRLRTATTAEGRHGLIGPEFTPDHKILTQRGRVPVERLVAGHDAILTDEREFNAQQLSVFLGCLLGDGGITEKNGKRCGFNFGQRESKAEYVRWKAAVFAAYAPVSVVVPPGQVRYCIPFTRYLRYLRDSYPRQTIDAHRHRKLVLTDAVFDALGLAGLAVWYQDDGTLINSVRHGRSSRIYCKITEEEAAVAVRRLTALFGAGITYNAHCRFIQISGEAFTAFHRSIAPYVHPCMAYKTVCPVTSVPEISSVVGAPFYETICAVVPATQRKRRRGLGVRYCLTVDVAGNFMTQAGFVSNCDDADCTRRIAKKLLQADPDTGQLTLRDSYGNDCWLPYWISHSASLAFLEMEMTGILVDFARVDSLTAQFMQVYEQLLAWFRKQINWEQSAPDAPVKHSGFNPNSSGHAKAFLFGDKFATRKDPVTKLQIPIRPPTAMTLGLTPIKSTGRRPKLWEVLQRRGELSGVSPSTDKETLGILGQKHPLAMTLRDLKFISQVLKSVLRRPNINKETGEPETTEDGFWEYDDGLVVYAGHDGRVRTHIYQTKETGRCSSARPALQCISKRREDDYRRILGYYDKKKKQDEGTYKQLYPAQYAHPLRSVLRATPGYVLVECDYTGAELAVIAWLSGDQNMIEHVRRNALPEDHPEFFDIHSQTAVRVFHLDCPPTKKGLKDAGFSGMRVAAKNVNFGVPYGRGAEAIARQCREEGVDVTPEQTQAVINFYFEQYPGTAKFLQQCRDGVVNPGWLSTAFGRLRRFTRSYDKSVLGEQERSAMNAPIQGTVADAVYRALAHLRAYRQERPALDYRLLLQIHDAILFEVRWDCVNEFVRVAAPECMVRRVPVWPRYLDGSFMPVTQPYFFSIDKEICVNWGEPITEAEAVAMGIDPELV